MRRLERLIDQACVAIARRFPERNIRRKDEEPYLDRYFILPPRKRTSADKDEERGLAKHGGLFLHHVLSSDDARALHNHPWSWGVSLILTGGYSEERRAKNGKVVRRRFWPGMFNVLSGDTFHRLDLYDGPAWTLFLHGPRRQRWGFWDRDTGVFRWWDEE